jgi:hypothetical protein
VLGRSQFFVTEILQTGNPPAMKSLSTAEVDWEERVSTKKLEKHGKLVTPTAAKAAVTSMPPSKNKGEATDPSQLVVVADEFVMAQYGEVAVQTDVGFARSRKFESAHCPALGFFTPDAQVWSHSSTVMVETPPPFVKAEMRNTS